jgi:hypothetical protein
MRAAAVRGEIPGCAGFSMQEKLWRLVNGKGLVGVVCRRLVLLYVRKAGERVCWPHFLRELGSVPGSLGSLRFPAQYTISDFGVKDKERNSRGCATQKCGISDLPMNRHTSERMGTQGFAREAPYQGTASAVPQSRRDIRASAPVRFASRSG